MRVDLKPAKVLAEVLVAPCPLAESLLYEHLVTTNARRHLYLRTRGVLRCSYQDQ